MLVGAGTGVNAVAVIGKSNAQQVLVIAEMVADMCYPVRLIDAATVREEDGLALSSRNRYLDAGQRERARVRASPRPCTRSRPAKP